MKKNILVTGSNGQLGSEIRELIGLTSDYFFFFTTSRELDITDRAGLEKYVDSNEISDIINCAAYTAVDKAEDETELADKVNHLGVRYLAEIAKERNIRLIHISTDYVFDGKGFRPYTIDHPTQPVNRYGETKLHGENALKAINPRNSMIIRTSWVYSSFGNNFVKTMLRLGKEKQEVNVIYDQIGVPTSAHDLATFIVKYALDVETEQVAVYHYTSEGVCSWYDFAKEIMELGKRNCKVNPIPAIFYQTPAQRPYYSVMDKIPLKNDFGIKIPYWKDSLKSCIKILLEDSRYKF